MAQTGTYLPRMTKVYLIDCSLLIAAQSVPGPRRGGPEISSPLLRSPKKNNLGAKYSVHPFLIPVPAPVAHKLPSVSHIPSGKHCTSRHASSDSSVISSSGAHFGSVYIYQTLHATSSIPAPQSTSGPRHDRKVADNTDQPTPTAAMSELDQTKPLEFYTVVLHDDPGTFPRNST